MTLGSLTWGVDPDEGPNGSVATPFPNRNAVMMIFEGRLPVWGASHVQPRP
jgi:hypothetical protein